MLVATAGHIDHGKTSLIRSLTGVDTDRLPEERARGISIDLGFAYWQPDSGATIGFVDVPGHERFVRNMLAGVGAVDFALLVIAADDGVMPQTAEHVQILDLLGITQGVVALTKCDRASPQQIAAARAQTQDLLAATALAGLPVFEVSSTSGAGMDALAGALRAARDAQPPRAATGRNFRLAVDRAFSIVGAGTVVAGTVRDGEIETGARLIVSPAGIAVRVRGLQTAHRTVTRVQAGERCALNLAGVELSQVRRGDWLLTPAMHAPTSRLDARLRVLPGRTAPLKHLATVHLYLGTGDIAARVLVPGQAGIAPGESALVQLVLEVAACAVSGDRFVLRDPSARELIGGGTVIDPFASAARRGAGERTRIAEAMALPQGLPSLRALLAIEGHEVDTERFERAHNLQAASAQDVYRQADAVLLGSTHTLALPAARVQAISAELLAALAEFHTAHPDAAGATRRDLKGRITTPVSAEAFVALQRDLVEKRQVETAGSLLRLPEHAAQANPADRVAWQKLLPRLRERGTQPFTARELTGELGINEAAARALLHRARDAGEVWRITEDRFMLRGQVAALAAVAAQVAEAAGAKGFTAAQYRDAIGSGRSLAIQVLEFFDSIGVTLRNGDLRRMRRDWALVVGEAVPDALSSPPPLPELKQLSGIAKGARKDGVRDRKDRY